MNEFVYPDTSTSSVWGDIISSLGNTASQIIGAVQGRTTYSTYPYVYNGTVRTPVNDYTGLLMLLLVVGVVYYLFFRK